jgi:hypothetical protein
LASLRLRAAAARKRRQAKEAESRRIALRKKKIEDWSELIAIGLATIILAVLMIYGIILYVRHLR